MSASEGPFLLLPPSWRALAARVRIGFDAWRYAARARRRSPSPASAITTAGATAGAAVDGAGRASRRPRAQRSPRPSVLVVSPYAIHPAVAGGSVRISNLLRSVAGDFDLHLALFSTTRDDGDQRAALSEFCRSVHFLRREDAPPSQPWSLLPRGAEYFAFEAARRDLRNIAETVDARIVQLEHTEMGQFARLFPGRRVTMTELDLSFVTAARRRALGFERRFAVDRLLWSDDVGYRRLLRYEVRAAESCDQVHVMSSADKEILGRYLRDGERRLRIVENGVDCARFRPREAGASAAHDVLFVGSFGHSPNRDAIEWLLAEIWPRLRRLRPESRLAIVGAHPPPEVTAHQGRDGVEVFGTVPETAAFYRAARVLLAPIRAGSGTRLKLLEAFASGLPVVATSLAAEGLAARDGEQLLIADSAAELAGATARVLGDPELAANLGRAARRRAEERYDWRACASSLTAAWDELLAGSPAPRDRIAPPASIAPITASDPRPASPASPQISRMAGPALPAGAVPGEKAAASESSRALPGSGIAVSVILPTRNGGERLAVALQEVLQQEIDVAFEVLCVDSASNQENLARMRRFPVRIESIPKESFNHGLTRDLGARLARGRVLVFLNQDAVPVDRLWLHRMTAPLLRPGRFAAVQGGIRELPEREEIFYWHSCGPRFYFTSESERWIARHGGIGFSTVNAALRREAWERLPFGWAPILEDKKWQAAAEQQGLEIADLPEAAVWHSHTYDLPTLWRRVASEGYGWRLLGERYSPAQMLRDLVHAATWRRWAAGLRSGELTSDAERLFPCVRPLALFWGNRWSRDVSL